MVRVRVRVIILFLGGGAIMNSFLRLFEVFYYIPSMFYSL